MPWRRPADRHVRPDPLPSAARRHVALGVGVHATGSMSLILMGTLAVGIRNDLGFGTAGQGLLISGEVLLAGITTVVAGRLIDATDGVSALLVAALAATAAMAGMAVAGSIVWFAAFFAVAGIAMGLAQPATDAWLSRVVPTGRQGLIFSTKQAAAGPGVGLLAGLAVPATEGLWGWRAAFAAGAGVAGTVALACMRSRPPVASVNPAPGEGQRTALEVLPLRPLIGLAVVGAVSTAPQASYLAFAVSSAVDSGIAKSTAGWIFAASSAVGIAARLYYGRRTDARQGSILGSVATLLLASVVGFVLCSVGSTLAIAIAMPLLAATAWGWHGLFFLVAVRTSPGAPGRASGFAGGGILAGAICGPLLFGVCAEQSYAIAWALAAMWSLAAAGSVLVVRTMIISAVGARSQEPRIDHIAIRPLAQ